MCKAMNKSDGDVFAITSLVLGIVAILFGLLGLVVFWWLSAIGIICSIIGIVMSDMAAKNGCTSDVRKVGLILSELSLAIVIAVLLFVFLIQMSL